jgi:hypothetical protein
MGTAETERSPEIQGKLRHFSRVLMSYIDFQQAGSIAHLMDGEYERLIKPEPGNRFFLQALNCAMILAYCRPFSGNDRGAAVRIPGLPTRFLRVLTEDERVLHEVVMKDRDERLAHSDSAAWEMEPVVLRLRNGREVMIPLHHSVHAPLTREATQRLRDMAGKLQEECFGERRRLEPELRPHFRVVEYGRGGH